MIKHTVKQKNEQSDSSEEEDFEVNDFILVISCLS